MNNQEHVLLSSPALLFIGVVVMFFLAFISIQNYLRKKHYLFEQITKQFRGAGINHTEKRYSIIGCLNGYKFIIKLYNSGSNGHLPGCSIVGIRATLFGDFPKQKAFMFDYPKLENDTIWQKNMLLNIITTQKIGEVTHTLEKMAELAADLENKSRYLKHNQSNRGCR